MFQEKKNLNEMMSKPHPKAIWRQKSQNLNWKFEIFELN